MTNKEYVKIIKQAAMIEENGLVVLSKESWDEILKRLENSMYMGPINVHSYEGKSIVDFCIHLFSHDSTQCDNFNMLFIQRPYTYRGMKHKYNRRYFDDIKIIDIIQNADIWKDYIIDCVKYGADCCTYIYAKVNCKSVNDLVYYCRDNISDNCIFQEMLTGEICNLAYVGMSHDKFENTVYSTEVEVDKDKKICHVYFMKNGGNDNA